MISTFKLLYVKKILILFVVLGVVASCAGPQPRILDSRYTPLHPLAGTDVNIRVEASDRGRGAGIREIRLFVFEYEQFLSSSGFWSARQRPGGRWGFVDRWNPPAGSALPISITRNFTLAGGFPNESYVTFILEVEDRDSKISTQSWSFNAGNSAFGSDAPILLLSPGDNGGPRKVFDIGFAADMDYPNSRAMLSDLEGLIYDGYQKSNLVQRGRKYWAFWYVNARGNSDGNCASGIPDSLQNSNLIDFKALVHTTPFRDCKNGDKFSTEPFNIGTALHETGHAALDLADEYSAGHQYSSSTPHHNVYTSEEECQNYNRSRGRPAEDCHKFEEGFTVDWWSPENTSPECIMRQDGDAALPDFKHACMGRAVWWYEQLESLTP